MKTTLSLLVILLFSNLLLAQTTAIPNANFEQALIDLGLDTGTPNGAVPTANIDTVTSLNVASKNITDLTGIEDFTALTHLDCKSNSLASLDITQNTALTFLNCYWNQLTSLDVTQNTALTSLTCSYNNLANLDFTQNTALTYLNCSYNQPTSLDFTQNTALTSLNCASNNLTSLDVTQNTALTFLDCGFNQLTSIDVTQNTALTDLMCWSNSLMNLDVTQNTALTFLDCYNNQLTSLDFTQNTALTYLACSSNNLTSLDVTQNTALIYLTCSVNQLNCLNVKNGNNTNFTWFLAISNPSLTCIEVDDVTWSTTNWTNIDPGASFSTSCSNPCAVGINEYDISSVSIYPNPTQGIFNIETPTQEDYFIEVINITGKVIYTEQIKTGGIKQIDLGEYSKGIYLLKLTNNKETIIEKIVYK